jgi:hypothetical protein
MTDTIASLAEARWDKVTDPSAHSIVDMLRIAANRIEAGDIAADHAIVVYTKAGEATGWLQAGSLDVYGQVGLLHRGAHLMMHDV